MIADTRWDAKNLVVVPPPSRLSKSEMLDVKWNETFERLKRYKALHGDCLVPRSYPADKALGHWCGNQRMLHKRKTLREDRRKRLEDIGFIFVADERYLWNGSRNNEHLEDHWQKLYDKLLEYRQQEGHVLVPKGYVQDGVPLGRWVCRQRTNLSQGSLRPDRKQKLEAIEFVWKPADIRGKKNPTVIYSSVDCSPIKKRRKKSDPLEILADLSSLQSKAPEDDRTDFSSDASASSASTSTSPSQHRTRIPVSPSPPPEEAAMLEELFLTHV